MNYLIVLLFSLNANALEIHFSPESKEFTEAAESYKSIWKSEGDKITKSMEKLTGLKFDNKPVNAVVYEGISSSGKDDIPLKLRASYTEGTKKATLIHELGHRLLDKVPTNSEIDEHRKLFLVLYEVWVDLYGKEFADVAVQVEKKRKGTYDYGAAWKWALALTPKERAEKYKSLVKNKTY